MQFRRLGRDGPEISVVGVGAWAIGGPWRFGWGPQDDDESIAALHKAFDAGVNWVDTAAVYGLGHSEEVVGQVVREHGGEVLVFTKCGRPWYGREGNEPTYDLRPETIRFELEQSLKRLGTDHVDLYQFHWPDTETGTPVEDSWAAMADLVTEGKVRWAGVSNFDVGLLERCERVRHVDSLQPPFSLIDRSAARRGSPGAPPTAPGCCATARSGRACSPAASTPTGCATCRPATGAGPTTSSARPSWRPTSSWPGGWSRWPSATGSRWPPSPSPGSWPPTG